MTRAPGDLIRKDPQSIEPQGFDWTAYLAELGAGITISTSTYTVTAEESPVTLTISGAGLLPGSLKTVITLTGGTVDVRYTVTNRIVTSNAVTDDRSFFVLVQER